MMKPCLECGTPQAAPRCPEHTVDTNPLPRNADTTGKRPSYPSEPAGCSRGAPIAAQPRTCRPTICPRRESARTPACESAWSTSRWSAARAAADAAQARRNDQRVARPVVGRIDPGGRRNLSYTPLAAEFDPAPFRIGVDDVAGLKSLSRRPDLEKAIGDGIAPHGTVVVAGFAARESDSEALNDRHWGSLS
jgi:hypothetical protein